MYNCTTYSCTSLALGNEGLREQRKKKNRKQTAKDSHSPLAIRGHSLSSVRVGRAAACARGSLPMTRPLRPCTESVPASISRRSCRALAAPVGVAPFDLLHAASIGIQILDPGARVCGRCCLPAPPPASFSFFPLFPLRSPCSSSLFSVSVLPCFFLPLLSLVLAPSRGKRARAKAHHRVLRRWWQLFSAPPALRI